jgi:hypothetical protein
MLLEHYSRRQNPSSGKSTQGINEQADIIKIGNYRVGQGLLPSSGGRIFLRRCTG